MTNATSNMYSLNIKQCVELICAIGHKRTIILEGLMGNAKSSMAAMVAKRMDIRRIMFDCSNKDLSDLMCPWPNKEKGCVEFLPNAEFGLHLNEPSVICFDEIGKAPPSLKNPLNGVMLERELCGQPFHPETVMFATTNKGVEGLGDLMQAHTRNRVIVVQVKPVTSEELVTFGINEGWDSIVLGFIKEFPQVLQSFEDVKNPDDNLYINHPQAVGRDACTTPRSLHAASDLLKLRGTLDHDTLSGALIGTIGAAAAMDMMAFVSLADQLPTLEAIKTDPTNAKVPDNASATCMVVFRLLATLDRGCANSYMTYLVRLSKEAQGMFANGVRSADYKQGDVLTTNKLFTQWCMENAYMFSADK